MKRFEPRKKSATDHPLVQGTARGLLDAAGLTLPSPFTMARVFAVTSARGSCYHKRAQPEQSAITIPTWAILRGQTYLNWYVAHELAHAFNMTHGGNAGHGPDFMRWLKAICPTESIHFELTYKPRNAAAAGIRKPRNEKRFSVLTNF